MKNEITITVTDQSGIQHILLCPLEMGLTLKDICKAYELPMEAMCGGMAMCATCHCFVLNETIPLPEKNDIEEALLSELFNSDITSRLACQIHLTANMDGLAVKIAAD
ncbi:2Fe-2S iron-sulfur cluster binding domain-containing protein [Chryseobacterium sp. Tr-659]|uniref:2Fe-2S iron-sulfur cluster-binding protein n=1 Tax=Chryseobacterium sp. Tr-659 TaxID=2608340 RepID=UPI0014213B76|nr:2Fe-2S iron-sulfur cluster-binding protein [Chryseobacterium sp. Tr-659]NIF06190.1 2Fe-2S iron-sulfur cluster binding domain-containing protein [Chryseobacterium sp. Tr-659]